MAGEPLDIQRLEVSCAAARHGLPTAPALATRGKCAHIA
jgi:hypothetical protein